MQKDPNHFSVEEAMRLANTPAGQQLIAMLRKTDTSSLQNAMNQASGGNYEEAKRALEPLLSSPEIQKLLQQLGGK